MEKNSIPIFLDTLIDVFLDNLLFYIPSEIIFDGVIEQIENIPDHFFDEISLLDLERGIYRVSDEDVLELNQRLFEKRSLLEENSFALLEKNKEVTPIEFKIILEKYYDQLIFYLYITDWLITNINRFNEDNVHLGILGAFKLQHEYLSVHLKNLYRYFGALIDTEREHNFSTEKMVLEHFPDLISRVSKSKFNAPITNQSEINTETEDKEKIIDNPSEIQQQIKKKTPPQKKQRPTIINEEIEKLILDSVFKVQMN